VAHWPWKKPLDYVGNQEHVTLGLGWVGVTIRRGHHHTPPGKTFTRSSNNLATSTALAEVYALRSTVCHSSSAQW